MTHSSCSDTGDKRLMFVQRNALLVLSLLIFQTQLYFCLQCVADASPLTSEVCFCLQHTCVKESRGWRHTSRSAQKGNVPRVGACGGVITEEWCPEGLVVHYWWPNPTEQTDESNLICELSHSIAPLIHTLSDCWCRTLTTNICSKCLTQSLKNLITIFLLSPMKRLQKKFNFWLLIWHEAHWLSATTEQEPLQPYVMTAGWGCTIYEPLQVETPKQQPAEGIFHCWTPQLCSEHHRFYRWWRH